MSSDCRAIVQYRQSRTHLSLLTGDGNAAILVVLDGGPSLLYQRAVTRCGEKGRDPCAPCPNPLCQRTLQGEGWRMKRGTQQENVQRMPWLLDVKQRFQQAASEWSVGLILILLTTNFHFF